MKNQDSQLKAVLNDLMNGVKMTALDALKWYGSMNLRNQISRLRGQGIRIHGDMIDIKTRYGKKRVMQYYIPNPDKNTL